MKRTRLSVCRRKRPFPTLDDATRAALAGGWVLRPYRCDRCGRFHLTSRRRGRHTPLAIRQALLLHDPSSGTGETVL